MKNKFQKKIKSLHRSRFEMNSGLHAISFNSEYLFKFFYNTIVSDDNFRRGISFNEQLESLKEIEKLAYEDGIKKEIIKFKREK